MCEPARIFKCDGAFSAVICVFEPYALAHGVIFSLQLPRRLVTCQEASQKSIKHLAKILRIMGNKNARKWTQTRLKILPTSFKLEIWRSSGQLLGASGRQEALQTLPRDLLNVSREALGTILVDLALSWARLGTSCGSPGGILGRTWSVLGLKNRVKVRQIDVERPFHLDFNF